MKNITINLVLLLVGITLVSCVDTIDIPDPVEPNKIVVECELSPPYHVRAFVATTGNLNGRSQPKFPHDADIRLYSEVDEEFVFKYNEEESVYEVKNGRLRPGFSYLIQANMGDEDNMIPISARTTIPRGGKLASSFAQMNNDTDESIISVDLELPSNEHQYYYLNLDVTSATLEGGERVPTGDLITSSYDKLISDRNGIHNLEHMPGILIDRSRLLDDKFSIDMSIDPQESKELIADKVKIDLKAVSDSYYHYQISVSNEVAALEKTSSTVDASVIEPNITYTNIKDGYGYFGAFTTTSDSITIQ